MDVVKVMKLVDLSISVIIGIIIIIIGTEGSLYLI